MPHEGRMMSRAYYKSVPGGLPVWVLLEAYRSLSLPTPPLQSPAAATDLISFLKVLLDCRLRGGCASRSDGC